MIRPDDLTGKARESYDLWRRMGLSEQASMNCLVEDGQVRLSEHDQLVEAFRSVFGVSEAAAEVAVRGRDVSLSLRSESEAGRSASRPQQGDALRLVARIEELAADMGRRGLEEIAALREAAFVAFQAMPDDRSQDWAAAVIGRRWPGLYEEGSSGSRPPRKPVRETPD